MPFLFWIDQMFPESQQPFEMHEILERTQRLYNPSVSRDALYRALKRAQRSKATAPEVVPVHTQPWQFTARGARRIVRIAVARKPCTRMPQGVEELFATRVQQE